MWTALMAALSRLVGSRVGQWFLAGLAFLGLSFVTQEYAVGPIRNLMAEALQGAPATLLNMIGFLNVDRYMTIVLSAYAVAASGKALKLRKR